MDIQSWSGDDQDFWRLPITSYAIGGRSTKKPTTAELNAMVDTGCSSLYLPSYIVHSYYATVPTYIQQNGVHLIPSQEVLPDLYLYVGQREYEVKILGMFLKPQGTNEHCRLKSCSFCLLK
jgi:hypothetical protein